MKVLQVIFSAELFYFFRHTSIENARVGPYFSLDLISSVKIILRPQHLTLDGFSHKGSVITFISKNII